MGYGDGGHFLGNPVQAALHLPLGGGVQRGGGLVQKQHRRALENSPGNSHALPLPARELASPLPHLGLVALRQALDEPVDVRPLRRPLQLPPGGPAVPQADVLLDGAVKQGTLLGHIGEEPPDALQRERLPRPAEIPDLPAGGPVKALHQLDEGGLSPAGAAHNSQPLPPMEGQVQVFDHVGNAVIGKAHRAELHRRVSLNGDFPVPPLQVLQGLAKQLVHPLHGYQIRLGQQQEGAQPVDGIRHHAHEGSVEHGGAQGQAVPCQQNADDEPHRLGGLGEEVHHAVGNANEVLVSHALLPDHPADLPVPLRQHLMEDEHPHHGDPPQGLHQKGCRIRDLLLGPALRRFGPGVQPQGQGQINPAIQDPRQGDAPVLHEKPDQCRGEHHGEADQVHHGKGAEGSGGPVGVVPQAGNVVPGSVFGEDAIGHPGYVAEHQLIEPAAAVLRRSGLKVFSRDHRRHQQQEDPQHQQQREEDVPLALPGDNVDEGLVHVGHGEE